MEDKRIRALIFTMKRLRGGGKFLLRDQRSDIYIYMQKHAGE
jgi:glycosylphosphatidylinositol transamidase (GPIT) subunit GPI8